MLQGKFYFITGFSDTSKGTLSRIASGLDDAEKFSSRNDIESTPELG